MAKDYYSVLARATAALAPSTEEARRAIYDRARLAIMDAGLSAEQTSAERTALENAIERVEADVAQAEQPRLRPAQRDAYGPATAAQTEHAPHPVSPRAIIGLGAAAAVLIVAIAGGVYWTRSSGSRDSAPKATAARAVPAAPVAPTERTTSGSADTSYIFKRQLMYYRSIHPAGTVVIAKSQRFLYLVRPDVVALRYTVGVGRECVNAVGLLLISAKQEESASGPTLAAANSVDSHAARWLSLGDTGHRIFGTNPPIISGADGCFRLVEEDVNDLYGRVSVGTRVVIN